MKNTRLGISIGLIAAALLVGGALAYNSANAAMVVGKNGGIAGNGANGGFIHGTNGTSLNGAAGTDANGLSMSAGK
jgi:hypothetical protein